MARSTQSRARTLNIREPYPKTTYGVRSSALPISACPCATMVMVVSSKSGAHSQTAFCTIAISRDGWSHGRFASRCSQAPFTIGSPQLGSAGCALRSRARNRYRTISQLRWHHHPLALTLTPTLTLLSHLPSYLHCASHPGQATYGYAHSSHGPSQLVILIQAQRRNASVDYELALHVHCEVHTTTGHQGRRRRNRRRGSLGINTMRMAEDGVRYSWDGG